MSQMRIQIINQPDGNLEVEVIKCRPFSEESIDVFVGNPTEVMNMVANWLQETNNLTKVDL